jgi:hypothetical protein
VNTYVTAMSPKPEFLSPKFQKIIDEIQGRFGTIIDGWSYISSQFSLDLKGLEDIETNLRPVVQKDYKQVIAPLPR